MHELTVALRIREMLEGEFADEPGLAVTAVALDVGALSGVVPAALEFAWTHAVADSPLLSDSNLEIVWVDVTGDCDTCQRNVAITSLQSFRCPTCGEPIEKVTGGDELDIRSVDVRETLPDSV